jgi:hypothetical protein
MLFLRIGELLHCFMELRSLIDRKVFLIFMHKIIQRLLWLKDFSVYRAFSKHNRKVFPGNRSSNQSQPIMLMELNAMHSSHIGYAYLAEAMAKLEAAQIKAFEQLTRKSLWQQLFFYFERALG